MSNEQATQGLLPPQAAAEQVLASAKAKFTERVDVAIRLGVDPTKTDQRVVGSVSLPNGSGKTERVTVIAQGDAVAQSLEAGADAAGLEEILAQIKAGKCDFDVLIATPETMRHVGTLGQILGPKGLMPNPKLGTVTADPASAVAEIKKGRVRYRTDKYGIVHCPLGNDTFSAHALCENLQALVADIKRMKPATSKGQYIKGCTMSSTMGPGIKCDINALATETV